MDIFHLYPTCYLQSEVIRDVIAHRHGKYQDREVFKRVMYNKDVYYNKQDYENLNIF